MMVTVETQPTQLHISEHRPWWPAFPYRLRLDNKTKGTLAAKAIVYGGTNG